MAVRYYSALGSLAAVLSSPQPASAAPPSPFPLRSYSCQIGAQGCTRLPKTWSEQGPNGKSGGTNAIESIELSYSYTFKAGVMVTAESAGIAKQCEMKFSQHLDASGGPDLGFYHKTMTQTVSTAPIGAPNDNDPLYDFYGGVSATLTDSKTIEGWYGAGPVSFANIVDLYPSQSQDKLACVWGWVASTTISGSVTINYREIVLYAPIGKGLPTPKLPPQLSKKPLQP
jgi:hypothetical protein